MWSIYYQQCATNGKDAKHSNRHNFISVQDNVAV